MDEPIRERSIVSCYLLSLTGFGLIWWLAATNRDMRRLLKEDLPSGWWLVVPFGGLWWLGRWARAANRVTGGAVSETTAWMFGWYAIGHVQAALNKAAREAPQLPEARVV